VAPALQRAHVERRLGASAALLAALGAPHAPHDECALQRVLAPAAAVGADDDE
jgi:hypothetical protein